VGESAVHVGDRRVAEFLQVAENVRLGLREIGRVPLNEQANAVRGAVNAKDKLQAHHSQNKAFRKTCTGSRKPGSQVFKPSLRLRGVPGAGK
jgi:hypothetical protein